MSDDAAKIAFYGELYFDHYESFLGSPTGRESCWCDGAPALQLLVYDNVFEDCMVYSTLGVSRYEAWIGRNIEVTMVVDDGFEDAGAILMSALLHCINNGLGLRPGVAVGRVDNINKEFAEKYGKSAIYFSVPYGFPDEYNVVLSGQDGVPNGRILLAFFITPAEHAYFKEHGADKFEDLLEAKSVDTFNISRESAV